MTDEVVTRLYRALVDELRRRGHPDGTPVKVSELYQTLVPYRSVRSALGVELNADYEHALLRLLAGERELLRLEPADAREELRREVEAPYPFVGLFRKFSASDVWVRMPDGALQPREVEAPSQAEHTPRPREAGMGEAGPLAAPSRPEAAPQRIAAEDDRVRLSAGGGPEPVPAPVRLHRAEPAVGEAALSGGACAFCEEGLPDGRRVRFCPHCGGDQRLRPCPRCDAVLERDWRFCISCGHEIKSG